MVRVNFRVRKCAETLKEAYLPKGKVIQLKVYTRGYQLVIHTLVHTLDRSLFGSEPPK